ncbi:MAG: ABC transporter permease [Desulfuromonadaceae bacterium]|nr:ABC transporter permease [Desulfuromonadaceae bacterium]
MKSIRVRAIAKKELIQVLRDPLSLAMAFIMPVILLLIFGYAITMDVNNLRTVVYDLDKSSLSRELVAQFRESGYFTVVRALDRPSDVDAALDANKGQVAIWIPAGFSENLRRGKIAPLQVVVDGSDSNTATIALGYVEGVTERFGQRLTGGVARPPIDARVRVWYNPELKSRNYIIPGLIAVIMAVIAALLTSLTIAREWERGTMEQLIATPVKTTELIAGKLLPYFFIGLIDVAVSVAMTVFIFDVPLRGSLSLLAFLSSIFLFGGISLGILISVVAKSQLVASQIAMVVSFLPAFLLSGFMYAISNMPFPLQNMTRIIPARYFVSILKGVFLKGSTLSQLASETILLTLFGAVTFAISVKKFKKRIL